MKAKSLFVEWKQPETWAEAEKEREESRARCEEDDKRFKRTHLKGYEQIMGLAGQAAAKAKGN
ncbi:MAG: hypothetical protein LBQ12_14170 [Deltaproteobacteria bacterium]|jgi:hypothetical protein|nr:hypothetical protein [Deltaproteobacteria bacterium]